jgi:uncharacterized lipoprotein YmbA
MNHRLWLASLALLAACGTPAKLNYYTLAVSPPSPPGASPAASAPSVYVGPVTIPETVDRPQMVKRLDANQVDFVDLERWAEPLKTAIPRVVAEAISRELGGATVMTSRQSATLAFDYRVALDVQRFDFSAGDGAAVDALWTIRAEKDAVLRTGRSEARAPAAGGGPEAMAAAESLALEKVAREIAAGIRSMDRK